MEACVYLEGYFDVKASYNGPYGQNFFTERILHVDPRVVDSLPVQSLGTVLDDR